MIAIARWHIYLSTIPVPPSVAETTTSSGVGGGDLGHAVARVTLHEQIPARHVVVVDRT